MSLRHLVVVFSLAAGAALALPVTPAYAAPTAVYVDSGGDDAHDCSQASPCLTVARGIEAVADGGTVSVGAGTFDGELRPGMLGKSVSMVGSGSGSGGTKLTVDSSHDGFVLEVGSGTTSLSDLSMMAGCSSTCTSTGPAV
ncbi:MAG: hypothetical protein WAV00_11320 [Nocardioides sp.]